MRADCRIGPTLEMAKSILDKMKKDWFRSETKEMVTRASMAGRWKTWKDDRTRDVTYRWLKATGGNDRWFKRPLKLQSTLWHLMCQSRILQKVYKFLKFIFNTFRKFFLHLRLVSVVRSKAPLRFIHPFIHFLFCPLHFIVRLSVPSSSRDEWESLQRARSIIHLPHLAKLLNCVGYLMYLAFCALDFWFSKK